MSDDNEQTEKSSIATDQLLRNQAYASYADTHFSQTALMTQSSVDATNRYFDVHFGPHLPLDRDTPILDIGCGAGHFLRYLKREGYSTAEGIDTSPQMVSYCHEHGVTNVTRVDALPFLRENRGRFGAIVMNDVIEHIPRVEILDAMTAVHEALNHGVVLIKTVNAAGLFGAYGRYIDFTHETGFTPESLQQVLLLCGFTEPTVLPLRMTPTSVKGKLLKFAGEKVVENAVRLMIMTQEGAHSRRPMILTETMMAVAKSGL